MKKIFLLLGCIVLICFAFSACDEAEESKADISKAESAVSQAVSETESEISEDVSAEESISEDVSAEESITEVSVTEESETSAESSENVIIDEESDYGDFKIVDKRYERTDPSGLQIWGNAIDDFYKDENFIYYFGFFPMSSYIIVEYSDGTSQNIREALADGNITIEDLDRFGIKYGKMEK